MSSLDAAPTTEGLVEFREVWLDDRRRCTWALCDVSFVADPDTLTALVAPPGEGAAEGVVDVLLGRRLPVRGRVQIDGVDLRDLRRRSHPWAENPGAGLDTSEQRITVAHRTVFVTHPTDETLAVADRVIVFDGGFAEEERPLVCAG